MRIGRSRSIVARPDSTTPSALPSTSILIRVMSSMPASTSSSGMASTVPVPVAASTRAMPVFEIAAFSGPGFHSGMSMSTRRQLSWIAALTAVARSTKPFCSRLRTRPANVTGFGSIETIRSAPHSRPKKTLWLP